MRRPLALLAGVAVTLSCAVGLAAPAQATPTTTATTAASAAFPATVAELRTQLDASALSPALIAKADAVLARAPQAVQARIDAVRTGTTSGPAEWSDVIRAVINPGDYQCSDTELVTWLNGRLDGVDFGSLLVLLLFGGLDVPTYDALLFQSADGSQRIGYHGEYTTLLSHELRDLKKFWDIYSADIGLVAMHGDVLTSVARTSRAIHFMFGLTDSPEDNELADQIAALLVDTVAADPVLDHGNNPIFTFNAFAFSGEGDPDPVLAAVPDKIIVGDGVLAGMAAIGLDDVAPRGILAHEFGHHVQYEDGLFDSPLTGPEATRRTELMADAFGTYFLVHKRGEAINKAKVLATEQSYYEVGDCSFDSDGHHGTPLQRQRSSAWAAGVVAGAPNQGHILPSLDLDRLFEAELPALVAPDAP